MERLRRGKDAYFSNCTVLPCIGRFAKSPRNTSDVATLLTSKVDSAYCPFNFKHYLTKLLYDLIHQLMFSLVQCC